MTDVHLPQESDPNPTQFNKNAENIISQLIYEEEQAKLKEQNSQSNKSKSKNRKKNKKNKNKKKKSEPQKKLAEPKKKSDGRSHEEEQPLKEETKDGPVDSVEEDELNITDEEMEAYFANLQKEWDDGPKKPKIVPNVSKEWVEGLREKLAHLDWRN